MNPSDPTAARAAAERLVLALARSLGRLAACDLPDRQRGWLSGAAYIVLAATVMVAAMLLQHLQ